MCRVIPSLHQIAFESNQGIGIGAQRNGPPRILQCLRVNDDLGCYHPSQTAYSYDYNECYAAKPGVDLRMIQQASEVLTKAMQDWRPTYDWRRCLK